MRVLGTFAAQQAGSLQCCGMFESAMGVIGGFQSILRTQSRQEHREIQDKFYDMERHTGAMISRYDSASGSPQCYDASTSIQQAKTIPQMAAAFGHYEESPTNMAQHGSTPLLPSPHLNNGLQCERLPLQSDNRGNVPNMPNKQRTRASLTDEDAAQIFRGRRTNFMQ